MVDALVTWRTCYLNANEVHIKYCQKATEEKDGSGN
jgi:hypothetical protein